MRFEIVDLVVPSRSTTLSVPPFTNPVRLGTHAGNEVRLSNPHVGREMAALENDATGKGWKFWNLNGKEITVSRAVVEADGKAEQVADFTLWAENQWVRLADPVVQVKCWPYVITVVFDRRDLATGGHDFDRLDRRGTDLVRSLHQELNDLLTGGTADPKEKLTPEYVLRLEQQIEDLARLHPDFPADDATRTEVGDHMAGVAVRSELVKLLIAESGEVTQTFKDRAEVDGWARLRLSNRAMDAKMDELVGAARDALRLGKGDDLSDQMRVLAERFWPWWRDLLRKPAAPGAQVRRYLALRRLKEEIKALWYGFGPLEDLLDDPTVTEIMVVDRDHIFIEKGGQIEDSGRRFLVDPKVIIDKIVQKAKRELNPNKPLVDVRMPDGSRVNAVDSDIALKGPCLTIRRFPKKRLQVEDLVARGSLSAAACEFLRVAVVNRRNVLVSGGTGTGKTTLLNCLSGFIPDKDRIVTIEDTAELQLQKEHVVTMQARPANVEGAGHVSIQELVKNSLRMRPDRIVVGECRGAEALDMLQAMNTGHDGSMTTLHANTPRDAVLRLLNMCQQAKGELTMEAVNQMIVSAVDLVVQLRAVLVPVTYPDGRTEKRKRRVVAEVAEVIGLEDDGTVRIKTLFDRDADDAPLLPTGHLPSFMPDLIAAGLVPDPTAFLGDLTTKAGG